MNKLVFLFFSLFLSFSLWGQELSAYTELDQLMAVNEGATRVEQSKDMMSEAEVLEEIEGLQVRLNHLSQEGAISHSAAFFASGILAATVFAIMYPVFWYFVHSIVAREESYGRLAPVVGSVVISLLPGIGVGALLDYANYTDDSLPHLSAEESLRLGVRGVIYASGCWLAGFPPVQYLTVGAQSISALDADGVFDLGESLMKWANLVILMVGPILYKQVMHQRYELRDEIFDLEIQLKEAKEVKEILEKKLSISRGRQFRSF